MTCTCGHDDHSWEEPTVCKNINCKCIKYVQATETNIVLSKHVVYLQHFESVRNQIMWILDNIKYLRNSKNKDFVDFYFEYVKVYTPKGTEPRQPDYETVRRAKQLLVAQMPDRFGPYDTNVIIEKDHKQIAMEEFVTQ